jgi:hypothetical protein
MGMGSLPAAGTNKGMFIHHLFLNSLHTNQTVSRREVIPETSRQEGTVAAILTRALRAQIVSVRGQHSDRPGRIFRAQVGHLSSLSQQLCVNDQGKGTAPTLRPLLPFLYKPHLPHPPLRNW